MISIRRLKQNGQPFVPITLAEAVVVNIPNQNGESEITTLDKVLQKTTGSDSLAAINNQILALQQQKQDKLLPGYGIEITKDNKINVTLHQTIYQVVTELPEPSANTMNVIYIVPIVNADATDQCAEYICVNEGNNYRWEQFGTIKTDTGLAGYVTNDTFYSYALTSDPVTTSAGHPVAVDYDIPTTLYDSAVVDITTDHIV